MITYDFSYGPSTTPHTCYARSTLVLNKPSSFTHTNTLNYEVRSNPLRQNVYI